MTKPKRTRKRRSSSDILDEFIDESLQEAKPTSHKRRSSSSSSSNRKRKRRRRSTETELTHTKAKTIAPFESAQSTATKKSKKSDKQPEGHRRSRVQLVEDPTDELLKRDQPTSKSKTFVDLIIGILIVAVFAALLIFYIKFDRAEVISASMEPTLMTNEKVVIMNGRSPKQFNLVVFYPPTDSKDKYVKRVIGLPGDEISYEDDVLHINGEMYEEPYLESNKKKFAKQQPEKPYTQDLTVENIPGVKKGTTTIPEDMYFVLGDNRQNSQDSRFIGLIPKDNIVGVVWKLDPTPQKIKPK